MLGRRNCNGRTRDTIVAIFRPKLRLCRVRIVGMRELTGATLVVGSACTHDGVVETVETNSGEVKQIL